MGTSFTELLQGLGVAATHPLAFVAYTLLIISWLVLGLRIHRNASLLLHLRSLPPKDRLPALKAEMGTVELKEGLSPEQWLRALIVRHYFYAFVAAITAATILLSLFLSQPHAAAEKPSVSVTLSPDS